MSLPRIASRRARGAARGRERVARVPRTLFRRVRVHGASGIVRLCSAGVPFDALDHRGRRLWIPRSPRRVRAPRARAAPGSGSTVARGCPWIPAPNGTPSTSRAAPEHRRGGSARPGRAITNDSAPSSPSPGGPSRFQAEETPEYVTVHGHGRAQPARVGAGAQLADFGLSSRNSGCRQSNAKSASFDNLARCGMIHLGQKNLKSSMY